MPESNIVYIVEAENDFSQSAKSLLESYSAEARIFSRLDNYAETKQCRASDVVIFDLHESSAETFQLLNRFLSAEKRPVIILFTTPKSTVKPNDLFIGERVYVLEHPIVPKDFMSAIQTALGSSYQ